MHFLDQNYFAVIDQPNPAKDVHDLELETTIFSNINEDMHNIIDIRLKLQDTHETDKDTVTPTLTRTSD